MKNSLEAKVGDVLFVENDGIFPACIKFYNLLNFKETGWTHTGIISEVRKNEVVVHEALAQGFVKSTYTKDYIQNRIEL